jgi:Uma2 family endonuclease
MATVEALMTAEEFANLPDDGRRLELVNGTMVEVAPPDPRHGATCFRAGCLIRDFIQGKNLGRVITNDSAIVTR